MDQKEQGLPLQSPDKNERARQFSALRNNTLMEMNKAIEKRRKENPTPTDEEILIGAFLEQIEPQVRNAVLTFYNKGYATESSGFYGENQGIDGNFHIDTETKKRLEDIGVEVDEKTNGYTWIKFSPEKSDLDAIKRKWDEIANILPSKGKPAAPSMSHGSIMFREKYGNPVTVERVLLERILARGDRNPDYLDRNSMIARLQRLKLIEENMTEKDMDKQKKWIEVTEMVDNLKDGLGKPVDRGIKKAVIAINALGFETRQSCEGHLDWGHAYPWVDINSKNYVNLNRQISKAFDQAEIAEKESAPKEKVDALYKKAHKLRKEMERPVLEEARIFNKYLEEFYRDRKVQHDRMLVLRPRGSTFILESQGAFLQEIADTEVRKKKLLEYRREMNDFTEFLKKKFFSGS